MEANLRQNFKSYEWLKVPVLDDVVVELKINPGGGSAEGRPEPVLDVDEEEEGDLTPDLFCV